MGTVSLYSTGLRTNISANLDDLPGEGSVFEGWLVDFSQYMVNPYTYNNFEVTEEPAEDPDPNAADSIAGFELQGPFGE